MWTDRSDDDGIFADVMGGLRSRPREIPCKYLYDRRGSELFNAICEVEEYYPTRTEVAVMATQLDAIADFVGPGAILVDLGAGNGEKTGMLLDRLEGLRAWVPVDISPVELRRCAGRLGRRFPELTVAPVCADYTGEWQLPATGPGRRVFAFPGSTVGNFSPEEARWFLQGLAEKAGPGGGLLVGVDLHKDRRILEAAYNDAAGVTAEFNKNLLRRINRECGADFRLETFVHRAVYNEEERRIEMRLWSTEEQGVWCGGEQFWFDPGEFIVTEHSYKYTIEAFAALAEDAQWRVRGLWTDRRQYFSVWALEAASELTGTGR